MRAEWGGFTIESIGVLLLGVYKYSPMSGSSYIQLPAFFEWKRTAINPQNVDQYYFKWVILARHVTGPTVFRVDENNKQHEDKYNFESISFPTPISDITKFEKNIQFVSVNVYVLKKKKKIPTAEEIPDI